MKIGVNMSINVSKIDKARLFEGKQGKYLDVITFIDIDEVGKYGHNGMVVEGITKEEKDAGGQGTILGNAKVFWRDDGKPVAGKEQGGQQQAPAQPAPNTDYDDDIPF